MTIVTRENGIEHLLTKIKHPWTNGLAERMKWTIKKTPVKRYHDDSHQLFEQHLADFINAYNYARRLKTLKRHANTSAKSGQTRPSGSRSIPSTECRH